MIAKEVCLHLQKESVKLMHSASVQRNYLLNLVSIICLDLSFSYKRPSYIRSSKITNEMSAH